MSWFKKSENQVKRQEVNTNEKIIKEKDEYGSYLNPNLPETNLTQLAYGLFKNCGLTFIIYGPSNLSECAKEVSRVAPVFKKTQALGNGLGSIGGRDDSYWIGYEGVEGSALAYFCFPGADVDFIDSNISMPLHNLSGSWKWGVGTINAKIPKGVELIVNNARAIPVWEIPIFEHTKPLEKPVAKIPELLRQQLIEVGAECVNDNLFKIIITTEANRSQMVFFATYNSDSFALMSPCADSIEGRIPDILQGKNFGSYKLDVLEPTIYLVDLLPAGPPSPTLDDIKDRSIDLAIYSDRIEANLSNEDKY